MRKIDKNKNVILPRCGVGMAFTNKIQIYEKMKCKNEIRFGLSKLPRNTIIFDSSSHNKLQLCGKRKIKEKEILHG